MRRLEILARLEEVQAELSRRGDDPRALGISECAQLLASLGESERSAELYLAAARHCVGSGQTLRAAVLARVAYRTFPAGEAANHALEIWRLYSGEDDSAFFEDKSTRPT
jgi:hypothetical protein